MRYNCFVSKPFLVYRLQGVADIFYFKRLLNQSILDVCQAYAESHGIIFNCSKTVCITFKTNSAISTVISLLRLGGQSGKSVDHYK